MQATPMVSWYFQAHRGDWPQLSKQIQKQEEAGERERRRKGREGEREGGIHKGVSGARG